MTPKRWLRWLLMASSVALIYATQMVSAIATNDAFLPVQLNGAVLTVMGVGFILAGQLFLAERAERLAVARDNVHTELLAQAVDLLRRLGHVEARVSTKVESLADQNAILGQLWADFAALLDAAAPDPGSNGVDPVVRAIGERVVRRIGRDGPVRH